MINITGIEVMNAENKIKELQAEIDALTQPKKEVVTVNGVKKNQKPGRVAAGRKYVLLDKQLKMWGKVPQQQRDLAVIMGGNMEVGKEYTEAELFELLTQGRSGFDSLAKSVQDPSYLFRYYMGLKNDGRHAGFIARDFIKQIG